MTGESGRIARAVRGEPEAMQALVSAHRPSAFRIAVGILGDPDFAEDVAQDCMVRLAAALPGFRGESELGTWVYRVTVNLCRDHLRRTSRRKDSTRLEDSEAKEPSVDAGRTREGEETRIDLERARRALDRAMDTLPDEQREAVTLRYLGDLSYSEIARVTSTPQGTIASRVFRALRRLGEELDPKHSDAIP